MRPGRPLLAAVPLALLLAGCGSAGTGSSTTSAGEYADNGSAPGSTTPPPGGASGGASGGAVAYRVADYTFPALSRRAPASRSSTATTSRTP